MQWATVGQEYVVFPDCRSMQNTDVCARSVSYGRPMTDQPRQRRDPPIRERLLAGLEVLGAASEVRTVAEAAEACTGLYVNNRQVASLRRSERTSWDARPSARPAYLAPALHHRGFEPIRGYLTSSEWDLPRRVVGPLSLRVDYLRATTNVSRRLAWARKQSPETANAFERLAWRLARSVPGGVRNGSVDPAAAIRAAQAELDLIEEEDQAQREEAAAKLEQLDRREQVFGVDPQSRKAA